MDLYEPSERGRSLSNVKSTVNKARLDAGVAGERYESEGKRSLMC